MTRSRQTSETGQLDPADPEIADLLLELSGEPPAGDTRAAFSIDDVAEVPESGDDPLTGRERELGYLEAGVDPTGGVVPRDTVSVESLVEGELTEDETFDPIIAAEEGVPWVPPADPVALPAGPDPAGGAGPAGRSGRRARRDRSGGCGCRRRDRDHRDRRTVRRRPSFKLPSG